MPIGRLSRFSEHDIGIANISDVWIGCCVCMQAPTLEYLAPLASPMVGRRLISLVDLLVETPSRAMGASGSRRMPRAGRRKRNRRRRGRGVVSTDGFNPLLAEGISKCDISHRHAGVWAFATYNGNAMTTAQAYLEHSGADVCFLQESRVAGDQLLSADRCAARTKWSLALEDAKRTEAGARCP